MLVLRLQGHPVQAHLRYLQKTPLIYSRKYKIVKNAALQILFYRFTAIINMLLKKNTKFLNIYNEFCKNNLNSP